MSFPGYYGSSVDIGRRERLRDRMRTGADGKRTGAASLIAPVAVAIQAVTIQTVTGMIRWRALAPYRRRRGRAPAGPQYARPTAQRSGTWRGRPGPRQWRQPARRQWGQPPRLTVRKTGQSPIGPRSEDKEAGDPLG